MNRRVKLLILALLISHLYPIPSYAAREDVGTSGAVFLKLGAGARPVAMGEAFGAVADDVNTIFFNPAGTALLQKSEFTAQYGLWFQSINYNMLAFAYPVKNIGTFGIGVINLSINDIEKRVADTADPDGEFGSSDFAYLVNYSRNVIKDVDAGLNVKVISQKIDNASATSYAADAGLLWRTPVNNLSAGLAVQNAGTPVKFTSEADPLPLNIKAGFGYRWPINARSMLVSGLDVNLPRDNSLLICAGTEYTQHFMKDISAHARAGYKTTSQEKLGGLSGLSAGAGITWKEFGFDFAWAPYGELGDTFRYALVVKF